jgi:hypothetical protein
MEARMQNGFNEIRLNMLTKTNARGVLDWAATRRAIIMPSIQIANIIASNELVMFKDNAMFLQNSSGYDSFEDEF